MRNFRANLFFRASASCSKIRNAKIYSIQLKISSHTLFFRTSASCSNPEWWKIYSMKWKIVRQTLFFRASASCSKFLNNKKYIHVHREKFQGTPYFSGQAQVAQKFWVWKVYSIEWKISGQAQVAKKSSGYEFFHPSNKMPCRTPMTLCMLGGFVETLWLPVAPDACGCFSTGGQVGVLFWHRSVKTSRGCSPWSVSYEDEWLFDFTTNLSDFTQHFLLTKERSATD